DRHILLANNSLKLLRLRSSDSGAYLCEAALHSGERITLLYDLQVQRLIPSFHNQPPSRQPNLRAQPPQAYIRLRHISLPYFKHDIQIAFRARSGLGLILYSGTAAPGKDFLSLSLVDWYLMYRFNLGSGSVLLRSRQRLRPGVWTVAGLSRSGRTGRLTVSVAE
uniref:LAM_G_DOMAIN domain-containing protein n=1 Tax=Macrostomum lignano TaxID=282301 RepID=A0A1I8GBX3_9PLAT